MGEEFVGNPTTCPMPGLPVMAALTGPWWSFLAMSQAGATIPTGGGTPTRNPPIISLAGRSSMATSTILTLMAMR